MKKTKTELDEERFYRALTSVIKRFTISKDLDVEQLEKLGQTGRLDINPSVIVSKEVYTVLKSAIFGSQSVMIIQLKTSITGTKLTAYLQREVTSIDFAKDDRAALTEFIGNEISGDKAIYKKELVNKTERYPKIFVYANEGIFGKYIPHPGYSTRPPTFNFGSDTQTNLRENSIIIVRKK